MNWQTRKLKDVCESVKMISPRSIFSAEFTYIDISSISSSLRKIIEPKVLPVEEAPSRARQLLKNKDILFAITRPYLKNIAFVNEEFDGAIASTGFCVIRPNTDLLDPDFAFMVINSDEFIDGVVAKQKGATYPAVKDSDIFEIEIPLPPLAIQHQIVAILDEKFARLREAKRLRQEAIGDTENILAATLREIFEEGKENGWEEKILPKISENLDSMRKPITKSDREEGVYPYYGASGIVDSVESYIFNEELLLISEDGANLIARSTPIAFIATGKYWVNNHAHVLRFKDKILQKMVAYYLNYIDLKPYITGSAQPKLNQANLNKIKILTPPIIEQQKIITRLDALSEKLRTLRELQRSQLEDMKKLEKAYLREAFRGELDVA